MREKSVSPLKLGLLVMWVIILTCSLFLTGCVWRVSNYRTRLCSILITLCCIQGQSVYIWNRIIANVIPTKSLASTQIDFLYDSLESVGYWFMSMSMVSPNIGQDHWCGTFTGTLSERLHYLHQHSEQSFVGWNICYDIHAKANTMDKALTSSSFATLHYQPYYARSTTLI